MNMKSVRVLLRCAAGLPGLAAFCLPLAAQEGPPARFEFAMVPRFADHAGPGGPASQPPAAPPAVPLKDALRETGRALKIFVLLGDQAVNSVSARSATAPVIEVRDDQNLPVQGAEVVFQLPAAGPGGFFAGQKQTWSGLTDANGQAVAAGFTPNLQAGRFSIGVTARHGGRLARAIIAQSNSLKPVVREGRGAGGRSGWWKVAAVAGVGGAVGGLLWANRRGPDRPTVVLQPGIIFIGGPR